MSSTAFDAAVNLAKLCVGVGLLALPFATAKGGIVFGPITMGIVAYWNWIACSMMIRCKAACSNISFPSGLNSTYSKIAYAGAGWPGVFIVDSSVIITLLGVCISYQITFADLVASIPGVTWCHNFLTILCVLIIYPVCLAKDVGVLSSFSLAGLVCIIVGILVILQNGVSTYGSDVINSAPAAEPVLMWPNQMNDITTFLGISFFCFGLCSLVFPVEESMKDKREFGKALAWSLILCWALYAFVGDIVALIYMHDPTGVKENILNNLPPQSYAATSVKIAMALVCLLTYPITILPPCTMIEQMILERWSKRAGANGANSLSLLNSSSSSRSTGSGSGSGTYQRIIGSSGSLGVQPGDKLTLELKDESPPIEASLPLRLVNRFLLMALCTVLSTSVPCFGVVVSLTGSFTVAILSFIMPAYLHLRIVSLPRYLEFDPEAADASLVGRLRRFSSINQDLSDWNHEVYSPRIRYYLDISLVILGIMFSALGTSYTVFNVYVRLTSGAQCS